MALLSATRHVLWRVAFSRSIGVAMMRLLLLLLTCTQWSIFQFDVKYAFLNGELHEVYIQPTVGYSVPDGMICRLRPSLYGLKQAPHA